MLKVVDVLIQYSKPARTNVRLERKALLTMQGENKASAKFSRLTRKMRAEAGMFHREVSPEVMHYRTDHSLSITSLQGFAKLKLKLKLQHRQQPLDQTPSKPHSQPSRSQSLHSHNEPLRSHKRSPSKSVPFPFPFPLPSLNPPHRTHQRPLHPNLHAPPYASKSQLPLHHPLNPQTLPVLHTLQHPLLTTFNRLLHLRAKRAHGQRTDGGVD